MLRNYFVILIATFWITLGSCLTSSEEDEIEADIGILAPTNPCEVENCETNIIVYSDFPSVGSVLDEVPDEINWVTVNLRKQNWFDAVGQCAESGQEAFYSKDKGLLESLKKGLSEKNCENDFFWISYHMLPDVLNDERWNIFSINRPSARLSEGEIKDLFRKGEPNRRTRPGTEDNPERNSCIHIRGQTGWDDHYCKELQPSLCQVTFRSF